MGGFESATARTCFALGRGAIPRSKEGKFTFLNVTKVYLLIIQPPELNINTRMKVVVFMFYPLLTLLYWTRVKHCYVV